MMTQGNPYDPSRPPAGYPPYPPPGYYQQPPRKKPVWPWVLGGMFLLMLLGIGGCLAFIGGVATNIDKESKRQVAVTYEVVGSGNSVSVSYTNSDNKPGTQDLGLAQETGVALPWQKEVTVDGLVKTATLTATNGAQGGEITCRIRADGKVIAEQTSKGQFATASCTGIW
jgi:hypothetical protein